MSGEARGDFLTWRRLGRTSRRRGRGYSFDPTATGLEFFYTGANLLDSLTVWERGLAIFGAVIFGGVGAYIGCRRAGARFLSFADALAPALLIAQAIGRLGCYFAEEFYGAPTTVR